MEFRKDGARAIRALLDVAPKTAMWVTSDGKDETVPMDVVQVGDGRASRLGRRCRRGRPY